MRKLTEADCEFTIRVLPEDIPVRGNAIVSGDDEYDREIEDKILADLEWNQWAWCCVQVTATFEGMTGNDYLSACSYRDEEDFKTGGYWEDMKAQAMGEIQEQLDAAVKALGNHSIPSWCYPPRTYQF